MIEMIGVPMDCGKRRQGCRMGPDALRVAGLANGLQSLGHEVTDRGNIAPQVAEDVATHPGAFELPACVGWTRALLAHGETIEPSQIPVFLGGDHAIAFGTVPAMAARAAHTDRPFFALWLDAHADFHTPDTSDSGHMHGMPLGYATGRAGFDAFPTLPATLNAENLCMIGLRSVDPEERFALEQGHAELVDMRMIDEVGIKTPLERFLERVHAAGGMLHVSLDVDFLDPSVAPGVGTTVPGGATVREAHLAMELLHDSGLVTSLDLVELNPFLDNRGQSAQLMVDLAASLFGRRVFDRPTRSHA